MQWLTDMNNPHQVCKVLKILLWLWFGTISSVVISDFVNIARLQSENQIIKTNIQSLKDRMLVYDMKSSNQQK